MRSPKILNISDDGYYKVNYIEAFRYIHYVDLDEVHEVMKDEIKTVTEQYYDFLMKSELYELPEKFKDAKILDNVMIVDGEQIK